MCLLGVAWMGAVPVGMMAAGGQRADGDALASWAGTHGRPPGRGRGRGCLRSAFYGRVSTEGWQDPVTSRARQLQQAVMLTAGRGVITAEFFDAGESRALPWARRPQAAALVAQLADPDRGWSPSAGITNVHSHQNKRRRTAQREERPESTCRGRRLSAGDDRACP